MTTAIHKSVLSEVILPRDSRQAKLVKQIALVLVGVMLLVLSAKIKIPMIPVPMTMGTFAVLSIGAVYGPRLGLMTIIGYMIVGALGFDVFASSSSEKFGVSYMMGSTGGYLVGYVLAILVLGWTARQGWDRSVLKMAAAMVLGNVIIYVPGLLWLATLYGWDQPILTWGLTPFLMGDLVKLGLAALLLPGAWRLVDKATK
ncbi:MAG: biotin transporter BioY [Planktomarina sp.]|nr:biotin transporter BioY [Planktomarina sp.]MDT2039659.1 biotin transporter BioY [Planktomarina sp.]|tara:strand:+ start:757 stop:1359 length:603 start_codon:yes stop_codon:yes gene_type:complete